MNEIKCIVSALMDGATVSPDYYNVSAYLLSVLRYRVANKGLVLSDSDIRILQSVYNVKMDKNLMFTQSTGIFLPTDLVGCKTESEKNTYNKIVAFVHSLSLPKLYYIVDTLNIFTIFVNEAKRKVQYGSKIGDFHGWYSFYRAQMGRCLSEYMDMVYLLYKFEYEKCEQDMDTGFAKELRCRLLEYGEKVHEIYMSEGDCKFYKYIISQ